MDVLDHPADLRRWRRSVGGHLGFVPTMGYLHAGHRSLMALARQRSDRVIASIFVNPLQFGPTEDLDSYPRDRQRDLAACAAEGIDAVFLPDPGTIYPPGFQTRVRVGPLGDPLCGASRPGHFDGVGTVVLKLINLVQPHLMVLGEKDFQQLAVLRRLVLDLDLDVEVLGAPIVREQDGLAMSSRNTNLTPEARRQATVLHHALEAAARAVADGERDPATLVAAARTDIARAPLAAIDYVELVDAGSLQPVPMPWTQPAVLALAVRFGAVRLIDNRVLRP